MKNMALALFIAVILFTPGYILVLGHVSILGESQPIVGAVLMLLGLILPMAVPHKPLKKSP